MTDTKVGIRLVADSSGFVSGARQAEDGIRRMGEAVQGLSGHAARMGHTLAAAFTAKEITQLYLSASKTAVEMQKLELTLKFASGNSATLNTNTAFLRQTVESLGPELKSASGAFASLTAAARGTKLEGEGARSIFDAVAKASTAMGLSAEETRGSLLAVQQMISKGTVSAEELRGQLGERLPGAFQIAARSMGVTTEALGKMLEQGQLTSEVFLPRFAAQMRLEMGGAAREAADSVQANFNRMSTAWTELEVVVSQGSFNNEMLKGLTEVLRSLSGVMKDNQVDATSWGTVLPEILSAAGDVALTVGSAFKQAGLDIVWATARLKNFLETQDEMSKGSILSRAGVQARADAARRGDVRAAAIDAARDADWKPAVRTDFTDKLLSNRAARSAEKARLNFAFTDPRRTDGGMTYEQMQAQKDRELLATNPKLGAGDGKGTGRARGKAEPPVWFDTLDAIEGRIKLWNAEMLRVNPLQGIDDDAINRMEAWRAKNEETLDALEVRDAEYLQGLLDANQRASIELIADQRQRGQALIELDRTTALRRLDAMKLTGQAAIDARGAIDVGAGIATSKLDQRLTEEAKRRTDSISDSLATGMLEGFRKGESFADVFLNELKAQFAKTILSPIIRPVVDAGNQVIGQLLNLVGNYFGGGSSVDTGLVGPPDLVGPLELGGGRAAGGSVQPRGLHPVNEQGPEVLTVDGQDYLMVGSKSGYVTASNRALRPVSASRAGAGGGTTVVQPQVQIQLINQSGTALQAEAKTRPDGGIDVLLSAFKDAVAGDISSGQGSIPRAMQGRYGLRPSFNSM